MEQDINKILEEIYLIDAELRTYEPDLKKIIEEIIAARPDTKFDQEFALKLRAEILERAKVLKNSRPAPVFLWLNFFKSLKFAYALVGAAVILLVISTFMPSQKPAGKNDLAQSAPVIDFGAGIKKVRKSQAFGSLGSVQAGNNESRSASPLGLGGGGAALTAPVAESDASAKIGIMPPFEAVAYKYIYSGEEIRQDQAEMSVYKRLKTDAGSQVLGQYVANMNFGLADLKQFKNAGIASLNINEDREFGYAAYLNLTENSMEIFANWEKWPRPDSKCRDEKCFADYRLKITDVPANEEIIAQADKFLSDYRINRQDYGEPVVMDAWRRQYELADNKVDYYIPEDMTVVYPLKIDGGTVYDTSGNPTGLYVGVSLRFDRVTNVNSILPNSYESSVYPALTDAAEILKLAEQGGLYPDYQPENAEKTVVVKLGTPKFGLIKYWSYDNENGAGSELLAPAYIFAVTNLDEISQTIPYFYRESVVVPLTKDIASAIQPPIGVLREPLPVDTLRAEEGGAEEPKLEEAPAVEMMKIE